MRTGVDGATLQRPVAMPVLADLRVHFVGIGGAGMSGAASLLLESGAVVSGSDLIPFDGLGQLTAAGALISIGHRAEQLPDPVDLVVISAAIPAENPELALARDRRLPVVKYAELLGRLMASARGVAIAGTHGKSTTTAMAVHCFRRAGLDPSFVVGARSAQTGGGSGRGCGPHLIVESCEYDRSFLHLWPESAAILNIEADHLDCYQDLEHVVGAFAEFATQVHPDGLLVCNADDPLVLEAAAATPAEMQTFGFRDSADWQAVDVQCTAGTHRFHVRYRGGRLFTTTLAVPGRHNVANALAATALACHAGAEPESVAEALAEFTGVQRRLTCRGDYSGVTVLDDYAHHPTEIRVTLEAARSRYQPRRMWVVFQPHQCSRTRYFMDQFAESLALADEIVIADVYGARESDPTACRNGAIELTARIHGLGGRARHAPSLEAVTPLLIEHVAHGDLVLTMGAGDVWKVADDLVARLCQPNPV